MAEYSTNYVFMSYSRKDESIMRRVADFLNNEGVHVWLDNEKLIPGTPIWEEEIEKAIKAAAAVIVLMSPDSKNSEWVRREISLADYHHKRIFPLLVRGDEDTSITLRLITRQFVDIRANEEVGLKSLSAALSYYLQGLDVQEKVPITAAIAEVPDVGDAPGQVQVSQKPAESLRRPGMEEAAASAGRIALLWITLGWIIGGAVGGAIYWAGGDYGEIIGGALGWAIGGLVTAVTLKVKHILLNWKSILWITLVCAMGGAIGWATGDWLTEASGAAAGGAIAAAIGFIPTSRTGQIRSDWKSILWIVLGWAIGWTIGWLISRYFQIQLDEGFIGWTIGWSVGSAIGGLVTGWQMMRRSNQELS